MPDLPHRAYAKTKELYQPSQNAEPITQADIAPDRYAFSDGRLHTTRCRMQTNATQTVRFQYVSANRTLPHCAATVVKFKGLLKP